MFLPCIMIHPQVVMLLVWPCILKPASDAFKFHSLGFEMPQRQAIGFQTMNYCHFYLLGAISGCCDSYRSYDEKPYNCLLKRPFIGSKCSKVLPELLIAPLRSSGTATYQIWHEESKSIRWPYQRALPCPAQCLCIDGPSASTMVAIFNSQGTTSHVSSLTTFVESGVLCQPNSTTQIMGTPLQRPQRDGPRQGHQRYKNDSLELKYHEDLLKKTSKDWNTVLSHKKSLKAQWMEFK